ncbi:MAG: pseudaminic acid cytidylyltransferase [Prosthecobacter sp.]
MKSIAIIPARGGSKRIPRKNIKPFLERPIISYVIQTALESGCFDVVMVSTDDEEIADIARTHGAEVPFMRSAENSTDQAITLYAIREAIEGYRKIGQEFDLLSCIYPTAVLTRPESLRDGKARLIDDPGVLCVLPMVRYSYPIQRAVYEKDGRIHMFQPEHCLTRSQDLVKSYHDAGQWYWIRTPAISAPDFKIIWTSSAPVIVDEMEVQDIDDESDWSMAELKYRLLNEK